MKKLKVSDFLNKDLVDYASYDNLRKIGSCIDGQKNASRKVLYTVLDKNIKDEIKVSQLDSKAAEYSDYLHGSMSGVITNMACKYSGSNNLNLLHPEGNFGTRFENAASAPRYIFTHKSNILDTLFNSNDRKVLLHQTFEGNDIEPMFYLPNLPLLLINGSEGVSSGFAQKILPRNTNNIKKALLQVLNNEKILEELLIPSYNGFNGIIEQGETKNQWLIKGKIERLNKTTLQITEIPIGYDLLGYISVLDDLEEKKFIKSYKDKSENDIFLFQITMTETDLNKFTEEELLQKLKLIKKVSENYTTMSEINSIKVFESVEDILKHYVNVKLKYLDKRKQYQLSEFEESIKLDFSKYLYIKNIIEENIKLYNDKKARKKSEIENDISKIENIIKKDNSFDYLLNMNMLSLTEERMNKLQEDIKNKKYEMDKLKETEIKDIWIDELSKI